LLTGLEPRTRQFFVSNASGDKGPVLNAVGAALVERILSAARDGKKFKVRAEDSPYLRILAAVG
jgi:hypothetical protein